MKEGYGLMEFQGTVILPDRILEYGRVVCDGGKISAIEELKRPKTEPLYYILPGLVDIHNHGAMSHDYMEATEEAFDAITAYLTSHGVTTAQCTTVSAPLNQILRLIQFYRKRLNERRGNETSCHLAGIHIEGPYIAPENKGAHPLETLLTPEDGYRWILDNSDVIGEVTVAPELPGMPQMIRDLRAEGIIVSGGHDHAELEDVQAAAENGMTHCTHLYCAMSTLHKTNGHRRCGLTEYAMTHDSLTAEIIADNHHVPPLLAKMVYQAKGAKKLCVVSDAIAPSGLPESAGEFQLGTGDECTRVIVENGVAMVKDRSCYAGSVQSVDLMIKNLVQDAAIPLVDAVRMASLTPAEVIGIDNECGSIEIGKRADLCIMDRNLHVRKTIIAGRVAFER